ncbi:hypothetical protein BDZ89DRAFT_945204 [Hymenopellis radicata]|nr:hypothetical protein BDZ89DRAFT_945204 [Hymenopellis radicata]
MQSINRFVLAADDRFGPITTIRKKGEPVKHIPWTAFKFTNEDWARVSDCTLLLDDANSIQQIFSSGKRPSIYKVIPAIETLQTAWKKKLKDPKFQLYHPALEAGLSKLLKYYMKFDEKPAYVLSLFVHPYYKFDWISRHWGGAEEQQREIDAGNPAARNWVDEAEKTIKAAVRIINFDLTTILNCSSR